MYYEEEYDALDAIKSNVVELHSGDCDYLEDAELMEAIFTDISKLRKKIDDLEAERNDYRRRALKAEFELKRQENKEGS